MSEAIEHPASQGSEPLSQLVRGILEEIEDQPDRPGLERTPERVARSLRQLTAGYDMRLADIVNGAIFEEPYEEMVVVRDIELYSLCEHHLLPFFGKAHVAYLACGRIIGLSKVPRVVEMFARRLQVQERLTTQIAEALHSVLEPYGVGVVIEASHLCMMMRGVQKQNSMAVTSALTGAMRTDPKCRTEFLSLIGHQSLASR